MEFFFLEHKLDRMFEQEQVRGVFPVELDAGLVVPLDPTRKLRTINEYDDHRCLVLHLLEVVEVFRVRLFGGNLFPPSGRTGREAIHHLIHRGTNEFSF